MLIFEFRKYKMASSLAVLQKGITVFTELGYIQLGFFWFTYFIILGIESRASYILGKYTTTELCPQSNICFLFYTDDILN